MTGRQYNIAVVGAGPAALYATGKLAKQGHQVVILNRDIKPGGLAEFGIYPNKYKMKTGLRRVFNKILSADNVHYFGHVRVGIDGDLRLEELHEIGFDAVVVAVGAQGTKWLGLPGEEAQAVFHAKDLVYHYNGLPPFSEREFEIGQHVAVVGLGNVCLDIVHWLVCEKKVRDVTSIARRGPFERACTDKELKLVGGALDTRQLKREIDAISPALKAVAQDPLQAYEELANFAGEALETESSTTFWMRFLRSPTAIEVAVDGAVTGLLCEKTELVLKNGRPSAKATGEQEVIPCDTVIFAIGDSIEPTIGLPLEPTYMREFATVPEAWSANPERPRYMVFDPERNEPLWDTFVVGWARQASDGLVGKARADAEQGCDEILAYLDGEFERKPGPGVNTDEVLNHLIKRFEARQVHYVDLAGVHQLTEVEKAEAEERGLPEFKIRSSQEMLQILKNLPLKLSS